MLQRLIRIREAKRAARNGDYREAFRCLDDPAVRDHRDTRDLRDRLTREILSAADGAVERREFAAAAHLLLTARDHGAPTAPLAATEARLEEARRAAADDAAANDRAAARIRNRAMAGSIVGARDQLRREGPDVAARVEPCIEQHASEIERLGARIEAALERDLPRARRLLRDALSAFPANRKLEALREHVTERWRADVVARLGRDDTGESLDERWRIRADAVRDDPAFGDTEAMRDATGVLRRALAAATVGAVGRGAPETVRDLVYPLREAGGEGAVLAEGVACWLRARELRAAGDLDRAIPVFQRAASALPDAAPLSEELAAAASARVERDAALESIGDALSRGEDRVAVDRLDALRAAGIAPTWVEPLRTELACRLDAGATALTDAARLIGEGRLEAARAALLPLLSGTDSRDAALQAWSEIEVRSRRAAEALARAESALLAAADDRAHLADAERHVAEARALDRDRGELDDVDRAVGARRQALDAVDEALRLLAAGAFEEARTACGNGLRHTPDHPRLRALLQESTERLASDLIERAARRFDVDDPEAAEALLDRAADLADASFDATRRVASLRRRHASTTKRPAVHPPAPPPVSETAPLVVRVEEGPEALLLTDDTISIGNARDPGNHIAIMANISSRHATIHRETSFHGGVSYRLRSTDGKACTVNGAPVREHELAHDDEIALGDGVVMRFRLPDPGSASAVLTVTRGYLVDDLRTVILMKGPGLDGRVRIGSAERVHLYTPRAAGLAELVLDAPGGVPRLTVRSDTGVEVDGTFHRGDAEVGRGRFVQCGECRFHIGSSGR